MSRLLIPLLALACAPTVGRVDPQDPGETAVDTVEREWVAQWLLGGLDRVVVQGSADVQPQCLIVRLVNPGFDGDPFNEVAVGEPWGLEGVGSNDLPCDPSDPWTGIDNPPAAIAGAIQVEGANQPTAVTLDIVITYDDGETEAVDTRVEIDNG